MISDERSPWMLGSHANADPRTPRDGPDRQAAIFHEQPVADEIEAIVRQRDAHRHGQIARSSTQFVNVGDRPAPAPHHGDPFDRIERTNQDRCGRSVRFGDDVHESVDAVIEVDVRVAGWTVQRRVAPCRPGRGVAGGIGFADVRLDLDDGAARHDAAPFVDENFSDQIAGDVERGAIVKRAREFHLPAAYACDRPSASTARR